MLTLVPQMRVFVAIVPVDFRNGIDGLCGVCRQVLSADPLSGHVFVFRNRRGTAVKLLMYDGQGFWLCQKRLSKGRFNWWPESASGGSLELEARQIQLMLWNGDPGGNALGELWCGLPGGGGKVPLKNS